MLDAQAPRTCGNTAIIKLRERIKIQTIEHRRLQHRKLAA